MYTLGPAISFLTRFWSLPQKLQWSSPGSGRPRSRRSQRREPPADSTIWCTRWWLRPRLEASSRRDAPCRCRRRTARWNSARNTSASRSASISRSWACLASASSASSMLSTVTRRLTLAKAVVSGGSKRRSCGSGLAGLETADLAVGNGEGPSGAHLAPGVVAVGGDQRPAAVPRLDHVEVAVHGEDLPFGPAGQVAVGAVVGHRGVRGERGEEPLAVPGVDRGDQGLDGGFGDVVGSHGSMMHGAPAVCWASGEAGDLAHLVHRVQRGDLVRLGQGGVVEDRVDEVVDRAAA